MYLSNKTDGGGNKYFQVTSKVTYKCVCACVHTCVCKTSHLCGCLNICDIIYIYIYIYIYMHVYKIERESMCVYMHACVLYKWMNEWVVDLLSFGAGHTWTIYDWRATAYHNNIKPFIDGWNILYRQKTLRGLQYRVHHGKDPYMAIN